MQLTLKPTRLIAATGAAVMLFTAVACDGQGLNVDTGGPVVKVTTSTKKAHKDATGGAAAAAGAGAAKNKLKDGKDKITWHVRSVITIPKGSVSIKVELEGELVRKFDSP